MTRFGLRVGVVAMIAFATATPSGASTTDVEPVTSSRKLEVLPFAAPGWLGWSESDPGRPHFNLVVRPDGGEPFRVNPEGTEGFAGRIEGSRLVYEQRKRRGDVAFYDLATRTHTPAPAGVNTTRNEALPSTSGDWLMYGRSKSPFKGDQEILLRNIATTEERVLATGSFEHRFIAPGNLAGDFATWMSCQGLSRCVVRRYQISTGSTTDIPNPRKNVQFGPSVTSDGTVYFLESLGLQPCAGRVSLWRFTPSGTRERLTRLPPKQDAGSTSPLVSGSTTTIFFHLVACPLAEVFKDVRSDLYKLAI